MYTSMDLTFFRNKPAIIKSDHHYPGSKDHPITVILYGRLGDKEFTKFHIILREMAEKSEINYVIRHYISVRRQSWDTCNANILFRI